MLRILVTGALYNILNIIVQVLLGLIVFREMLLHFGEADFGTWSLLFAILAHIKLFEFGLGSLVSKLVPILKVDDRGQTQSHFSTALISLTTISLVFFILLIPLSFLINQSVMQFENSTSPFGLILFLLGCNFLFLFQTGVLHAYLTGNFKVGRLNSVRLFINILRGVLIIVLLQLDYSILTIALVFAGTAVLEFSLLFILSVNVGLFIDFNFTSCTVDSFKYVVNRGSKLLFLRINGYTRQNAPIIICGFLLGVVAIVPLRIAGRLMEIYVQISTSLNLLLTPYFSSISLGDKNTFNRNFLVSITCATSLSAIIFLNIFFVGDWFLLLWLGDVPEYTLSILQITAIGFCIANMQGPCTSVLISKDKNKTLMAVCIVEILVLIITIYPAVELYGVIGAAYSLTLSLLVSRGVFQPILICNTLELSLLKYFLNILIPALILLLVLMLLFVIAKSLNLGSENLSVLAFIVMQGLMMLAIAAYFYKKKKQ